MDWDQKLVLNLRGSWFRFGSDISASVVFADAVEWNERPRTAFPDLVPVGVAEIRSSSVKTFLAELEGSYFRVQAGQRGQWRCVRIHMVKPLGTTSKIFPVLGVAL